MTAWRHAFRVGFAPQFSVDQLRDLRAALVRDARELIGGATVLGAGPGGSAPPYAACPVGWIGWQCDGMATVNGVHAFFADTCREADRRLGEAHSCRFFLNAWDDGPRDEMRPLLIAEIDRELEQRLRPDRSDDKHRTLDAVAGGDGFTPGGNMACADGT